LRRALQQVVDRHEALRTTFSPAGDTQTVAPRLTLDVPLTDLSDRPPERREAEAARLVDAEDRKPFDLATGPLLRARVVRLEAERHVLLLTVHHVACDGWSYDIVLRELAALYTAAVTGTPANLPTTTSFRAYARRAAEDAQTAEAERVRSYW